MTKQELMENCTAEQLADMAVAYEEQKDKKQINNANVDFLGEIEKIEEYRDARAEDLSVCGADSLFGEVKGLNYVLEKIRKFRFEVGEIEDLKEENNKKQEEIAGLKSKVEKYRKAFENAKKERDCQIAELQKKIDELTTENSELHCELQAIKAFSDEIPTEPIKVADMLINSEGEYEHNPLVKKICGNDKGTCRIFDISDLRQIAEHLLVYCNHNGEMEE